MTEQNENKGLSLPVAILIAAVLIAGSIIYLVGSLNRGAQPGGNQAQNPAPSAADMQKLLAPGGRDVILGEEKAPVTLVEYGDYQCPFCARFYKNTELLIRENYIRTGKVRMIFRDLAFLGPESQATGEAAECAKDQGKFWAYHDALYETELADAQENNGNLNRDLFLKLAKDNGLDVPAFAACYDSHKYAQTVQDVTKQANNAGIQATPTSFVNGVAIQGAQPYETFGQAIDSASKGR